MSAHYFDVIRFSYCVVFKAGFVCVCIYVFFTQKTKKEGKNVAWCGVDPVSTAPTCRFSPGGYSREFWIGVCREGP